MGTRRDHDERLTVVTFNVHGWTDAAALPNAWRVLELLRAHKPDIVGLQEVLATPIGEGDARTTTLAWLADQLGYHHTGALRRGCALLSRFPISSHANLEDRGPPYVRTPRKRKSDVLRLVGCALETPWGPLHVHVLHLNYQSGERRLAQLGQAWWGAEERTPSLWIGDLNALCPADYDTRRWAAIAKVRAKNRWEPPRGDTTKQLAEHGLVDCWRRAGCRGEIGTCRFDTRVDYVWADQAFLDAWTLQRCHRLEGGGSDHHAVLAEFTRSGA